MTAFRQGLDHHPFKCLFDCFLCCVAFPCGYGKLRVAEGDFITYLLFSQFSFLYCAAAMPPRVPPDLLPQRVSPRASSFRARRGLLGFRFLFHLLQLEAKEIIVAILVAANFIFSNLPCGKLQLHSVAAPLRKESLRYFLRGIKVMYLSRAKGHVLRHRPRGRDSPLR